MKFAPIIIIVFVVLACRPPRGETERFEQDEPFVKPFFASIDYTKPRWERVSDSYIVLNIEVKNTTKDPLEFLKAEASFYDKGDAFIRSQSIYIDRWERLAPGDRSPSSIHTTYDPRVKSVRLRFTCRDPKTLGSVDVFATQVDRIE
ncbi:MAG: hypothetical protein WBO10_07905 [Pyrinomonadaceae bacterium]